ncbi:MAG TPA: hypothetical protein VLI05_02190 [Candidatus Saccharimonadia bacterium]|nr:hypothetical protein [Candidatus Saccharimonadia bacterium]
MSARGCQFLAVALFTLGLTAGAPVAATVWAGGSECSVGYDQSYLIPDASPEGLTSARSQGQAQSYGWLPPTLLPAGPYELTSLEVTGASSQPALAAMARLCRASSQVNLSPSNLGNEADQHDCPAGQAAVSFNNPEVPGLGQYGLEPRTTQWLAAGAYQLAARRQDGRNLVLCFRPTPVTAIATMASTAPNSFLDQLSVPQVLGLIIGATILLTALIVGCTRLTHWWLTRTDRKNSQNQDQEESA